MPNKKDGYCGFCGENVIFYEGEDFLWHCTKCENIYESMETDSIEDETVCEYTIGEIIKCPFCNTLIEIKSSEDSIWCPYCFEELKNNI